MFLDHCVLNKKKNIILTETDNGLSRLEIKRKQSKLSLRPLSQATSSS